MYKTFDRCVRKYDLTVSLDRLRAARRPRAAMLVGALAILALAIVPSAVAATGGAASFSPPAPTPAPAATETTTAPTETAAAPIPTEAELSFKPYRYAGASWYGGTSMWGRSTACGQTLTPTTIGVANKRLPCGTPVKFVWHGLSVVAPVIDRGPFVKGRAWDLTEAAATAIGFEGIGRIQYAVAN